MIINRKSIDSCRNAKLREVLEELKAYESYCKLLDGSLSTYVRTFDVTGKMPAQLKEWLKIFDGGLLFDVNMFSTRDKAKGQFNRILTFSEVNSATYKQQSGIHEEIVCFAMTSYGNFYCYVPEENSECIYEWDVEKQALTVHWNDFSEWLEEMIGLAKSMIDEDLLDPLED